MKIFRFAIAWFTPVVALYHHGRSGTQKTGELASAGDRGMENKLSGTSQGTLSQFEGPVQQSPFYKALLTQGTEATSNAYNAARSNMRERANAAGFGYNQPVEQGAENQLGAQEASALAKQPQEAMLAATAPALTAADQTGRMATAYGGQGVGYYDAAAQQDQQRQKSGLWNQLWNLYDQSAQGAGMALAG